MNDSNNSHTHTVYAYQRLGKKSGRMLECGTGRIDADRNVAYVVMNRQPIGGYTGYVVMMPHGMKPEPQRPVQPNEADSGDEE